MRKEEIEKLLPAVFQNSVGQQPAGRGDLLTAILAVMELLHAPVEAILDDLDHHLHPDMVDERMLTYLAHWVGLGPLLPSDGSPFRFGTNRLRDLVWAAVKIARLRGTCEGITTLLMAATGTKPFTILEAKKRPFHLEIYYPVEAAPFLPLINQILELEKPAYATYELKEQTAVLQPSGHETVVGAKGPRTNNL
ncbi:MAG: phage tail protein [Chloroflexota bacterium]